MRHGARIVGCLTGLVACIGIAAASQAAPNRSSPIEFVENRGQWDTVARFVAWTRNTVTRIEPDALVLEVQGRDARGPRGAMVRIAFECGADNPAIVGETALPGSRNYFIGNDRRHWRTGVRAFASVRYRDVWDGIDFRVREGHGRCVEYDLILAPHARLDRAVFRCEGAQSIRITSSGSLRIETPVGTLHMHAPTTWEEIDGRSRPVRSGFRILPRSRFAFWADRHDEEATLVVDPTIVWSTLIGGFFGEKITKMKQLAGGDVLVAGQAGSSDFPTTPGVFDRVYKHLFVSRFTAGGTSLVYSTFMGGTGLREILSGLLVDPQGNVTLAGWTESTDFPTTPGARQPMLGGFRAGFLSRLSADGSTLAYSSYFGGSASTNINGLDALSSGDLVIVGQTTSKDFPTTSGVFSTAPTGNDVFVTRLTPDARHLVFSTFITGGGSPFPSAVEVAPDDRIVVIGQTTGALPVTPGAFMTVPAGGNDAFVLSIAATGRTLDYATFIGGRGHDTPRALAVAPNGDVIVTGTTISLNFPTTPGAFDRTYNGTGFSIDDVFVTRLTADGSHVQFSTYLGSAKSDFPTGVALDQGERVVVIGATQGMNFPTTPNASSTAAWGAFVSRLSPSGTRLDYSTLVPPSTPFDLALSGTDTITFVGEAADAHFPTTPGAFQTTKPSFYPDAFVTRLEMLPSNVSSYGNSTAGCKGPLLAGVTEEPRVGGAAFEITCIGAPQSSAGVLAVARRRLASPVTVLGAAIWIDPTAGLVGVPVTSDALGECTVPIPIPAAPQLAGQRFYLQFAWPDTCAPGGLSASNALATMIEPQP